jgi:hypothetical protein
MNEEPRATVRNIDGQIVLDDPDGLALMKAVEKHNCRNTLLAQAERVEHFARLAAEMGRSDLVIVLLNVNDREASVLANALMPGANWQQYIDRGEIPCARGLAERAGVVGFLVAIDDQETASKLEAMTELAVLVMDRGVAEVFLAKGAGK